MIRPPQHPFRPALGLANPHLQTTWGRLVRSPRRMRLVRESLATPDGDELLLDHLPAPHAGPGGAGLPPLPAGAATPHVLLLHGLEGSSNSVYIQGLLQVLAGRGAAATVLNFRSCARDPNDLRRWIPNRGARLYHSGETTDLEFVISTLVARRGGAPLRAIGVSLGGNVLLKWLGEHPGDPRVERAATMSVPYDLEAGARHLERGLGRRYTEVFLRTLRAKSEEAAARSRVARERLDLGRARAARTFFDFDDAATAPLHGFAGAHDYYVRSSSIGFLPRILTPTLCLSAADDPFVPAELLERVRKAAPAPVRLEFTPRGGHAGFVAGSAWRPRYWGEERLAGWILAADSRHA